MLNAFSNSNLPTESCIVPQAIKTTQLFINSATSVTFSWRAINFTVNAVIGYEIEYRQSEIDPEWTVYSGNPINQVGVGEIITITVNDLNAGQWYEFRVRPILNDGCQGLWDTSTSQQKLPLLTPFTDPDWETWLNPFTPSAAGASNNNTYFRVAPINDNTIFIAPKTGVGFVNGVITNFISGTSYTFDGSDYIDFPCDGGNVLQANNQATVFCWDKDSLTGYNYGSTHSWEAAKPWHLSRDFIFGAFRNNLQRFQIYSLTGTSPTVEVWKQDALEVNDTLVNIINGVGGSMITFDHNDASDVYSFRSDEPVVIFHYSISTNNVGDYRNVYDQKILNPPAIRVISASTRNAASSARYDGTSPTASASSVGMLPSPPISRSQGVIPNGLPNDGSQYNGDSLYFDGFNLPVITSPGADGDGTKQTMAQDIDTLGTSVRIPGPINNTVSATYQFLKFASPFNFTIEEFDENGLSLGLTNSNGVGPYELRFTDLEANHLFVSDMVVIAILEVGDDDETNIWSSK